MASIQNLTLADVKPIIGNLSRANYYQVLFGGFSPQLLSYLSSRDVGIQFIGNDFGLMCNQAVLPGSSLGSTESSNFHGVTENFAYQKIFTEISLSFYCDDEYRGLKFLEHWMEYAVSGNNTRTNLYGSNRYNYRMRYPDDALSGYKSQSTKIVKFENNFKQTMEYSFIGLFPKSLSSTPVRYGSNSELTQISCSFSFDRYVAGSINSYDYILGNSNNLASNLRTGLQIGTDIVNFVNRLNNGDGLGVFNSLIN